MESAPPGPPNHMNSYEIGAQGPKNGKLLPRAIKPNDFICKVGPGPQNTHSYGIWAQGPQTMNSLAQLFLLASSKFKKPCKK